MSSYVAGDSKFFFSKFVTYSHFFSFQQPLHWLVEYGPDSVALSDFSQFNRLARSQYFAWRILDDFYYTILVTFYFCLLILSYKNVLWINHWAHNIFCFVLNLISSRCQNNCNRENWSIFINLHNYFVYSKIQIKVHTLIQHCKKQNHLQFDFI